jgi:hypothetical protein
MSFYNYSYISFPILQYSLVVCLFCNRKFLFPKTLRLCWVILFPLHSITETIYSQIKIFVHLVAFKLVTRPNVQVTGHSLGGAMASVCAALAIKLNMWSTQNVKLVTFGQPRTGDLDYAEGHNSLVSVHSQQNVLADCVSSCQRATVFHASRNLKDCRFYTITAWCTLTTWYRTFRLRSLITGSTRPTTIAMRSGTTTT